MTEDYDGLEVYDTDGQSIGKVERTYVDDSNAPRFVEVKFGTLLPKHRLIPTADSDLTDEGQLRVAYSKDTIEASPDAPKSDTLEVGDLDQINDYYGQDSGSDEERGRTVQADSASVSTDSNAEIVPEESHANHQFDVVDESSGGLQVGDQIPAGLDAPIQDRGDVVEVPVLEEILVKKTVVREILRVKKSDMIEHQTVEGDVRKEDLEVDDEPGAVVDSPGTPTSH